ncbi:hypothetical protein PMSM_16320 [Paenibacillus macquariensis subsp. macquariensis]|uniref:Uncharacterized protein n=1 Tax=Paenibacillus macquariensis TaxID=948756 RepID=A0ABY1KEE0_9BACL|nr:hypothetical protein PMSM_16320 [Paenibacillus macquariensis subsp. macquariensis]SIR70671.1 hypothetical protein SAMN05421578_13814 [Paenibacillus macquariensis]
MDYLNKIPVKAFAIYYLSIVLWGIMGVISFSNKADFIILISFGLITFVRTLKFGENLDRSTSILICCALGLYVSTITL